MERVLHIMHLPPDGKQLEFHLTPSVGDVLSDGLGADVMRVITFDPLLVAACPRKGHITGTGQLAGSPKKRVVSEAASPWIRL